MVNLLVFSDDRSVKSINEQIITRLKDELDQIYVVLSSEDVTIDIPHNWKQIKKDDIRKSTYEVGVYIHATDENKLLSKKDNENIFTILFQENNSLLYSLADGFDLIVYKKENELMDTNLDNEYVINTSNKSEINNFISTFKRHKKVSIRLLDTPSNMLQFSRNNSNTRYLVEFLVSQDYTLVDYVDGENIFVKRSELPTTLPKTIAGLELCVDNGVFYTLEKQIKNDANATKRLIVIFSSMPGSNEYFSDKFEERTFVKHFPTIQKLLVPNTNVLRIIDSNLMYGSHYINTNNFPNYEDNIQNIISNVRKNLNVSSDNVVLYGTSKGATGALVHSLIGSYKSVTVDPILDATEYNFNMNNIHYIKNNREQSLIDRINKLLNTQNKIMDNIVIRSPQVKFNYDITKKIHDGYIKFYDQKNSNIKKHAEIGKNSVSEILMFLNAQLLNLAIKVEN